jgi:hypothetical protein
MMKRKMWIGIPASWGFCLLAQAHEGHGVAGQGHTLQHQLFEPVHWPGWVAVLMIVVLLIWALGKIRKQTPLFQGVRKFRLSRDAK